MIFMIFSWNLKLLCDFSELSWFLTDLVPSPSAPLPERPQAASGFASGLASGEMSPIAREMTPPYGGSPEVGAPFFILLVYGETPLYDNIYVESQTPLYDKIECQTPLHDKK